MSDTFKGRPIFPLRLNLAPEETRLIYDDNPVEAGFGAPVLTPAQTHARRRLKLTAGSLSAAQVQAVEDWLEEVGTGARSAWVTCELDELRVLSVADDGPKTFRIAGEGLEAAFPLAPGVVLRVFSPADASITPLTITDVVADGDEEIVTVDEDLPAGFSAAWHVARLILARVLDLAWQHASEGLSAVDLAALELPLDYGDPAAADTASSFVEAWLYLLTRYISDRDIVGWRLTSAQLQVTHDGKAYSPAQIDHGQLSTGTEGDTDTLALTLGDWADNPFRAWFPRHLAGSYGVTLAKVAFNPATGASVGDAVTVFRGMVTEVKRKGSLFTVSCKSGLALDGRVAPSFLVQTTCGYNVYQQDTCRLRGEDFELEGDLDAVDPDNAQLDFECAGLAAKAADWLVGGAITITHGDERETRTIRDAEALTSTKHRLTLSAPTVLAAVADSAVAKPGCDKLPATCGTKFDNFINFGGAPKLSAKNLSVQAMPSAGTPSSFGKK